MRLDLSLKLGSTALNGGGAISSFSGVKAKLLANTGNASILAIGDSTGNASNEFLYQFADWLGDQYPAYTVIYYLWDGTAYDVGTTLSTGSGANTLHFYNCSVGGTEPNEYLGSTKAAAVQAMTADLVIWNHGHNIATASATADMRGAILSGWETLRECQPTANVMAILQNPDRDDDDKAAVVTATRFCAALYGDVTLVEIYQRWINAGKPSGWYTDNVHPNATGQAENLAELQAVWTNSRGASRSVAPGLMSVSGAQLIANGSFAAFTLAAPDSWVPTPGPAPVVTKELVIVDAGDPYSVKMVGVATSDRMRNVCDAAARTAAIAAGSVTLAARVYCATGQDARIGLVVGAPGANVLTLPNRIKGKDGWQWIFLVGHPVPSGVSNLQVALYSDTATVYFGMASMVAGSRPANI